MQWRWLAGALVVGGCGAPSAEAPGGGSVSSSAGDDAPAGETTTDASVSDDAIGDEDDDGPAETGESSGGADAESEGGSGGDTGPIPLDCEGSVLADLSEGMPARSWRKFPDNASLDALQMEYSLLYWNDSAVWDATRRQLHWIGGPGTCCADPAQYMRMTYDELSDAWTITETPFVGSGHAYDGNALDPQTGDHYFALFSDPLVHRFDGVDWDTLPEIPFEAQATMGLTWFDAMGGLVYVGGFGNVAHFDGAAWTQLSGAEDAPWGSYNTFAEHSAPLELVWVGGGNGGEGINYVIDATGAMRRGADAPISLNNGSSIKSVDPISGRFLVGATGAGDWWEYDPAGDVWTALDDMIDQPDLAEQSVFHVPVANCGVTLFFGHYWDERDVYLYRHSSVQ